MKDQDTTQKITHLIRAETEMCVCRTMTDTAHRHISKVVPPDHPIHKALEEAKLALAKADILTTQLLTRFQR